LRSKSPLQILPPADRLLPTAFVNEALTADKKVKDGKVRFILPTAIGKVTISDRVISPMVREVLPPTDQFN
jgi:3-dehydroquinate synthetase